MVYDVIKASAGNSWMFENRIPHVLANDYAPRSAVETFTKDLGIVADVAREKQFATRWLPQPCSCFLGGDGQKMTTRRWPDSMRAAGGRDSQLTGTLNP